LRALRRASIGVLVLVFAEQAVPHAKPAATNRTRQRMWTFGRLFDGTPKLLLPTMVTSVVFPLAMRTIGQRVLLCFTAFNLCVSAWITPEHTSRPSEEKLGSLIEGMRMAEAPEE